MPIAALVIAAALIACGGGSEPPTPTPGDEPPAAPTPPTPPAAARTPAPWSAPPLEEAPAVSLRQWRQAANRETCALLAFQDTGPAGEDAVPRGASFSGGWGVAYDLPGLRSAFGIAGTGVEPGPTTYDDWPHHVRWLDGSVAGYGPEGGNGPNQLAYLRVAGQECLYNVWSRIGIDHLERLLGEIRFVEGAGA